MYRWFLLILLCTAVHGAPQDSDITYVKIQPLNIDPQLATSSRESRDQLPPGNPPENVNQTESTTDNQSATTKLDLTNVTPDPISETIDPSIINKLNRIASDDPSRPTVKIVQNEQANKNSNQSESSNQFENANRFVRSDVTAIYETTTDIVTETEKDLPQTVQIEARTRPPLRYLSKLSYYKSTAAYGGSDVNLLERVGKRRFRSKCRCEKIWNCPKLQISVPRCPEEYFLCCF